MKDFKSIGIIGGRIEIFIKNISPVSNIVGLISTSNFYELSTEEALDLGDVITYAATNQLDLLPDCPHFRKAENL